MIVLLQSITDSFIAAETGHASTHQTHACRRLTQHPGVPPPFLVQHLVLPPSQY